MCKWKNQEKWATILGKDTTPNFANIANIANIANFVNFANFATT